MKHAARVLLSLAGLAILLVLLFPDQPERVQPAGNPGIFYERPPLFENDSSVLVADTSGSVQPVNVSEADEVALAVSVEADTTGAPVQLLVDRPAPAWFPEADLVETNIRIRTLSPRQAPLVTVVQQRMPVFDVELEPIAGMIVGNDPVVFAGVMLFRAWIFHGGFGAEYLVDTGIRFDVPVAIEIKPNLMVGATIREKRAFLAYRF